MKRFYGILLATAMAPAIAMAADTVTFENVDVQADLDEVKANALDFWPDLTTDLEAAIQTKLSDHWSETGKTIEVNIREVSMNGSQGLTGEGEFNHLEGWVYVMPEDMKDDIKEVKITIDAVTGPAEITPNTVAVILPSDGDFYNALIEGFADKTAESVKDM